MENPIDINEKYFVRDGCLLERNRFQQQWASGETVAYEVLRVRKGIPLFLEDHLARLEHSCQIIGRSIDLSRVAASINLCIGNSVSIEKNLKFTALFNRKSPSPLSMLAFFIPTKYPTDLDYSMGVATELLWASRTNPNAKIENAGLRQQANEAIARHNLYEVILVNAMGNLTEGSRSNLFFTKGSTLYTPPAIEVLEGITRKKILELAHARGIEFIQRSISHTELRRFDGCFITGTSPKVLPVNRIGNISYNPNHPLLRQIGRLYDGLIDDYIARSANR